MFIVFVFPIPPDFKCFGYLILKRKHSKTNAVFRECVCERVSVQRMSLIMLLTMLQMLDRGMISRTNCNADIIGFLKTSTMVAY